MIEAYLYSCCNRNGKIKKMKGWVDYESYTGPDDKAHFLSITTNRRYVVPNRPGNVFKDAVWLLKPNDDAAMDLIKERKMHEIKELERLLKRRYSIYENVGMMHDEEETYE